PEQLTVAEQEGRRQAFAYEKFFRDRVPGFADANIIGLSHQIGVRETRRVFGEYRLTREDCLGVARFEDRVLLCGAPIEDHRAAAGGGEETEWAYVPGGAAYDVPYRTLIPRGRDEIWVAGRCFSATHSAHASCRSMGQTMAMGQAVGTAASLSLEQNCGAREVPAGELQQRLRAAGAILEMPAAVAATGSGDWRKNL
ncbi:MAG: FAD-dependent oxidoreductase, partial [Verrucomicrobia bacterium]|nr:FAD-dependent oxidoreductase [Verrucomicrobiota bacterium]